MDGYRCGQWLPISNPKNSSCNFRGRVKIPALSAVKAHAGSPKRIAANESFDARFLKMELFKSHTEAHTDSHDTRTLHTYDS